MFSALKMSPHFKKGLWAFFFLICLVSLGVFAGGEWKPKAQAADEKIVIAPHRAVYKMSLASVKNGSTVASVSGKMMFEWGDSCDGWAVEQHLNLHFQYAEGDDSDVSSSVLTWESKDGKKYRFQVRRVTDGKETENYKGLGTLGDTGGLAIYSQPKNKPSIHFPKDTLFPSAHTIEILRHALAGDNMFTRRVFDGSDEQGDADVAAFISKQKVDGKEPDLAPSVRDNPLLKSPYWPVRLSFYKPDDQTSLPQYEMDMLLQKNGIGRSVVIDYGDFAVQGILVELEPLPTPSCVLPH